MSYIDTSVIVAALDPEDPRSTGARRILESGGYKVVSELVLVELASVLSRRGLVSSLASKLHLSEEQVVATALLYLLRRFNLRYRPLESQTVATPYGRVGSVAAAAIELSTKLRLKTLDLLHVAYVKLLRDRGEPISTLETADADFKRAEDQLRKAVGVSLSLIEA